MIQRLRSLCILLVGLSALALHAVPPGRPQIDITSYVIHADLDPSTGKLTATAAVTFTALDDLNVVVFGLNNGLQVSKIADTTNAALNSERNVTDSTIRVTPAALLAKGSSTTYTFTYAGTPTVETSPVDGIKLVQIADPVSVLLYAGRWFPMTGLFTDRFTAEMHITVPEGERVVGSGVSGEHKLPGGGTEYIFNWTKPGFPGTIVAGKFLPPITTPGIPNIRVFVTDKYKEKGQDFAATVAKEFEFMTNLFGGAESGRLEVVELPGDSVSAAWAPEIVAIRPDRGNARLFANTVARQWWGSETSPATLNDAWITNGMSRYAELLYLEDSAGKTALQSAISDVEAGALAYDTEPLTTLGRLDPFSPQFQSMTLEKGAMVFHMLRWEMGDDVFQQFLRSLLSQYTDKPVRTANVQTVAEAQSKLQLTPFFSQWLDGTGAPELGNNFSVFRLGSNKGFRTVGSVTQDLDLFRMPIELRIETEGKTEERRVDLSGTESAYSIETFGRPRRITIDPENWVLKSTPDLAVRIAVLRGQQEVAQGDLMAAITEYQKALDSNRSSSLANYRLAEIFFTQRNYQASANSFRDSLRGDGDPKWTEVWSHINLGRIFDVTGQRDRAVNEYRLAVQTNDNTQGAINEARALMQKPYQREPAAN
ncbi:M1 family aminopeptidase [Granulicella mallensis]|uniref:Aminopeptidase N/predicted negative regulator of RcsB-dependent stress response n=1 Tax=Granulicella mallensis TaxID=940614 RepID=A0A7W7ZSW3_9BACT|nr:M1 family aminopeptidase [Granulicella mallensis]MBB5065496.1 aminopeptidase N/predicted negative regulator of RcsB-dependent stress response [Granulicella mallensis]